MHANGALGGQRLALGRPVPTTTLSTRRARTLHGGVRPVRRTRGVALKTQAAFGWGSPKSKDKQDDPDEGNTSVEEEAPGVGTAPPPPPSPPPAPSLNRLSKFFLRGGRMTLAGCVGWCACSRRAHGG